MDPVNILPPTEYLPDESLFALKGDIPLEDIGDNPGRCQTKDIQQGRNTGMEKAPRAHRHGVLIWSKMRKRALLGPCPERFGVTARSREPIHVQAPGVPREARLDGSGAGGSPFQKSLFFGSKLYFPPVGFPPSIRMPVRRLTCL